MPGRLCSYRVIINILTSAPVLAPSSRATRRTLRLVMRRRGSRLSMEKSSWNEVTPGIRSATIWRKSGRMVLSIWRKSRRSVLSETWWKWVLSELKSVLCSNLGAILFQNSEKT